MNQSIDTKHLEAFKAFAASQPPDQVINHVSGYTACAIGAYGNTVGAYTGDELQDLANDIIGQGQAIDGLRNIANVINVPGVARQIIPTYGKLFEYLNIKDC